MKLKIYGSRGSMAFFSKTHVEYGGNSVCAALDIDGHIILLDGGTGLMQFYYDMKGRFTSGFRFDMLLSHLHLDHIIGFSMFSPILSPDSNIRIFTKSRNELPLVSQVFGVFRPPYWPVEIAKETYAKVIGISGEKPFTLNNNIKVTPFFTEHHNETVAYRIDADKSVVYLMDYEMQENADKYDKLTGFCQNADLIIFDAAYLQEDYPAKRGWGHSTFEDGMALAEASACKRMIFSHISQDYPDAVLNAVRDRLNGPKYTIAFDGMEIEV